MAQHRHNSQQHTQRLSEGLGLLVMIVEGSAILGPWLRDLSSTLRQPH